MQLGSLTFVSLLCCRVTTGVILPVLYEYVTKHASSVNIWMNPKIMEDKSMWSTWLDTAQPECASSKAVKAFVMRYPASARESILKEVLHIGVLTCESRFDNQIPSIEDLQTVALNQVLATKCQEAMVGLQHHVDQLSAVLSGLQVIVKVTYLHFAALDSVMLSVPYQSAGVTVAA